MCIRDRVSSYGSATRTSGVVRIVKDLDVDLADRHVLVVEDIVDSGLTLNYLQRYLLARRPASLEVCALLVKDGQQRTEIDLLFFFFFFFFFLVVFFFWGGGGGGGGGRAIHA